MGSFCTTANNKHIQRNQVHVIQVGSSSSTTPQFPIHKNETQKRSERSGEKQLEVGNKEAQCLFFLLLLL